MALRTPLFLTIFLVLTAVNLSTSNSDRAEKKQRKMNLSYLKFDAPEGFFLQAPLEIQEDQLQSNAEQRDGLVPTVLLLEDL